MLQPNIHNSLFQVAVVIWNAPALQEFGRYRLHHASVAGVTVSPGERFVVSAGGKDDASFVVWSVEQRAPLCGKKMDFL